MSITIPLPKPPTLKLSEGNKAVFEIEGLYPGYGLTVGNALRRVLLSSLPGAAITSFQIRGVHHEFSTIPGVTEDAVEISLNLKRLRFKMFTDEVQKLLLKKKGEGEVNAGDFDKNANVEIVTPQAHIFTVTSKNTALELEVTIEKGIGYSQVESRKKEKLPIGVIAIDAIYTPVRLVNFEVENMRVGDRTDYNRLLLHVETDGTMSPVEAMERASQILIDHFRLIRENLVTEGLRQPSPEEAEDIIKMKVAELSVSRRTANALTRGGIKTLGGLLRHRAGDLEGLEGLGEKGIEEIKSALEKIGFSLKE